MSTRSASRTLVTAPTVEPVTLAEAKDHLRITAIREESTVSNVVTASRAWAESFTRRAFITQTWDLKLDYFPECIDLPLGKTQSITAASFTYVDTDGATTQVPTSTYVLDTDSDPGRVYLDYNQTWPTSRDQPRAISLRFVTGYGLAAAVPYPIKQAILMICGSMYEYRETMIAGVSVSEVPFAAESLLLPYQLAPEF